MSFWRVLVIGGKATPFAVGKAVLGTNIVLPPGDGKSWLTDDEISDAVDRVQATLDKKPEWPWMKRKSA
jgi:hypothetical protein